MNINKGITLVELIIAISLLSLVTLTASGIYLSGWNMFRDAQYRCQSQRNAMIPIMRMVNDLQQAQRVEQAGGNLQVTFYPIPGDWLTTASRQYQFDNIARQIKCIYQNTSEEVIGSHIADMQFGISHNTGTSGIVTNIHINADDSRGLGDYYTIETAVECGYGPAEEAA